jgi:p-hydroxybenzoate 3-monooxygenase
MSSHILRTQVGIVGAGPAGLLSSHLLHLCGIDSIVIETRSRFHIEERTRAGMLDPATVQVLTRSGVGARMHAEGLSHTGTQFHFRGVTHRVDFQALTGQSILIYGQREIVKDLIAARLANDGQILFDASAVALDEIDSENPSITFNRDGDSYRVECDFIIGSDGFHGVCRPSIGNFISVFEQVHSIGWLGVLAESPPISGEIVYACHERGLALFSMRSPSISRMYLQCSATEDLGQWPDDRIWDELRTRLDDRGSELVGGPILEKTVFPLRSFVVQPLQHGRLFLVGDAAHIVPPSAAKGLNLAVADTCLLVDALVRIYRDKSETLLKAYSRTALSAIWETQRFSQWMTALLHRGAQGTPFERRVQLAELDALVHSSSAVLNFATSYVGKSIDEFRPRIRGAA